MAGVAVAEYIREAKVKRKRLSVIACRACGAYRIGRAKRFRVDRLVCPRCGSRDLWMWR